MIELQNGLTTTNDLLLVAKKWNIPLKIYTIFELEGEPAKQYYARKKNVNIVVILLPDPVSKIGHWVAIRKTGNKVFYFDSLGIFPDQRIINFMRPFDEELYINTTQIQNHRGAFCGAYVMAFLYYIQGKNPVIKWDKFINSFKNRGVYRLKNL